MWAREFGGLHVGLLHLHASWTAEIGSSFLSVRLFSRSEVFYWDVKRYERLLSFFSDRKVFIKNNNGSFAINSVEFEMSWRLLLREQALKMRVVQVKTLVLRMEQNVYSH